MQAQTIVAESKLLPALEIHFGARGSLFAATAKLLWSEVRTQAAGIQSILWYSQIGSK
jgi:hypothetical protein